MHADSSVIFFFFFNDTATTEIYTLSLHDALPILAHQQPCVRGCVGLLGGQLFQRGRSRLPDSPLSDAQWALRLLRIVLRSAVFCDYSIAESGLYYSSTAASSGFRSHRRGARSGVAVSTFA